MSGPYRGKIGSIDCQARSRVTVPAILIARVVLWKSQLMLTLKPVLQSRLELSPLKKQTQRERERERMREREREREREIDRERERD